MGEKVKIIYIFFIGVSDIMDIPLEWFVSADFIALIIGLGSLTGALGVLYEAYKDKQNTTDTNTTTLTNTLINTLEDRNELLSTKIDALEQRIDRLEADLKECRKVEVRYEKLKTKHYVGMMYLEASDAYISSGCDKELPVPEVPYLLEADLKKLKRGEGLDY